VEKNNRILVIGGTGFIGYHFLLAAKKKEANISSLSLHPPNRDRLVKGVKYLHGDILNLIELKKILQKKEFEYVVNFGGYIKHTLFHEGGRQFIEEHFTAIQNLLTILNRDKLIRFVQIGSSDEYGNTTPPQHEKLREDPISPYSLGKVASTHFLQMLHKTEAFPAVILRLFLTYGPGQNEQRFLPQIIRGCLSNRNFPTSAGEQLRDFCYVEDVIHAIFLVLENDSVNGEVFNIASGQPVSIRSVIESAQNLIGKGEPCFGKVPYRLGENMCLYADTSKARHLLRWEPLHNMQDGLNKTIAWYSENG